MRSARTAHWATGASGKRSGQRHRYFFRAAESFAAARASDDAFAALERAYAQREGPLIFLAVHPPFAPLRGDPRFAELVKRMKLPLPAD